MEGVSCLSLKKWLVRFVVLALCLATLTVCFSVSAAEKSLQCTYVKITGNGFVADTFNGVEARYNLYGRKLYCTELVTRYFKEVFGLDVQCRGAAGPVVVGNEEYWFEKTENPQPGDVLFGSAAARGVGYNHWAICKAVNVEANTMTLFEQNWRWNGRAGVNRMIPYDKNCYVAYQLVNADGRVLTEAEKLALEQQKAVVLAKETVLAEAKTAALLVM